MTKIIIVGAGQAGAGAALNLRELGFDGEITLLGDEVHPPYERPELSKGYVLGTTEFEKLVMLTPQKAQELNIDMRLGWTVSRIDRDNKQIWSGAQMLPYDHLILATGGGARRLPLPQAVQSKTHVVRTREDADALATALKTAKTVAVIGGGWLGLEAAATCRQSGAEVHVFEAAPRLCARVAPIWLSDHLAQLHRSHGVHLHLGHVPQISDTGVFQTQELQLTPDLVIVAIGMSAYDRLAVDAGLDCDDGVLVTANGLTSDPSIYAIGDCARYPHLGNLRRESWQNANQSSLDAATAIIGGKPRATEPDWFWSNQFGQNIQMLGRCTDDFDQVLRVTGDAQSQFFFQNTVLKGVIAVNAPRDIGMSRGLISKGNAMDMDKVRDPSVVLRKAVAAA